MDYNLGHPKRKSIFKQFLYNKELRFNEIEKLTSIRSNELAYFLQKLVDEGVVVKKGEKYVLAPQAEKYIPFFVDSDEKMSPLPVVLVACVKEGKVLLWKRQKRPYEAKWSLPGGRIRLSESIADASVRVLKNISYIDGELLSVNAVVNEKHIEEDSLKHAFILIFTRVKPLTDIKGSASVQWFNPKELPEDMIPSDKWLVQSKLDDRVWLEEEHIIDKAGKISMKRQFGKIDPE